MSYAIWPLLFAIAFCSGYLGWLAGREGAESRCAATIADLRVALRKATERSGK